MERKTVMKVKDKHIKLSNLGWVELKTLHDETFAGNLRSQLLHKPSLSHDEKKILAIIESRPSRRRTRRIAAMESNVKEQLLNKRKLPPSFGFRIDWSQIDWPTVFQWVLKILIALIPFLLMIL